MASRKTKTDKPSDSNGSTATRGRRSKARSEQDQPADLPAELVPLHEITQTRYLNYALSVITS
ncbi:MAG TPA: hypothetical protein VFU02_14500, partial [Polyangiaceae bacterium]|nr:hypothetical protein [Polyangiaceae bacterium]